MLSRGLDTIGFTDPYLIGLGRCSTLFLNLSFSSCHHLWKLICLIIWQPTSSSYNGKEILRFPVTTRQWTLTQATWIHTTPSRIFLKLPCYCYPPINFQISQAVSFLYVFWYISFSFPTFLSYPPLAGHRKNVHCCATQATCPDLLREMAYIRLTKTVFVDLDISLWRCFEK